MLFVFVKVCKGLIKPNFLNIFDTKQKMALVRNKNIPCHRQKGCFSIG